MSIPASVVQIDVLPSVLSMGIEKPPTVFSIGVTVGGQDVREDAIAKSRQLGP